MKNKSTLLIFVLFASIFANFVFAGTEPITLNLPQDPHIINQPNPALEDINRFYIKWEHTNPNLPVIASIEQKLRDIFRESDIDVLENTFDGNSSMGKALKKRISDVNGMKFYQYPYVTPEFHIDLEIVNIPDAGNCVFRLQTSFVKKAILENGPKANMMAKVWEDEPVMSIVSIKDLNESVTTATIGQAKLFIQSVSDAKRADKKLNVEPATDKSNKTTEAKKVKQQVIESKFVASKNGKVFHKPGCSSAKRISAENLVNYASREEAIAAGKRPCKQCKP